MNKSTSFMISTTNITQTEIDEIIHKAHIQKIVDHVPLITGLLISAIIGIIGNIITVIFYGKQPKIASTNVFIKYLAIFDLITCFLIFTTVADLFVNIRFTNSILCKFVYFFNQSFIMSSGYTLLIISIDRYRKVCKPFSKQFSARSATVTSILVLFISLVWSSHNFVTLSTVKVNISTEDERMPVIIGHYCTNTDEPNFQTVVAVFHIFDVISAIIVLTVFIYTYGQIWRYLRKHNKKMTYIKQLPDSHNTNYRDRVSEISQIHSSSNKSNHTSQSVVMSDALSESVNNEHMLSRATIDSGSERSVVSLANIQDSGNNESVTAQRSKSLLKSYDLERNVSIMMFVASVVLIICFTPYFVVSIGIRLSPKTTEQELNTGIEFALRSVFWNGVINPFIFCMFNSKYRYFVKEMFVKCRFSKAVCGK